MWYYDDREIKPNRAYYSDEHGYVCDCSRSRDPYEMLCWICQEYVDAQRQEEAMLDETMESIDEDGTGEETGTSGSS
jgi:hypothetical protein